MKSETLPPFSEMTAEQFQTHLDERSVNTHDAASVATFFSQDGVQRRVGVGDGARGRDAIRDAVQEVFNGFPDARLEVRDLFSAGDRMCVQCTFTGTHRGEFLGMPPTERHVSYDVCLVFRLDSDGLVKEEVVYFDALTMLQQLGVVPAQSG